MESARRASEIHKRRTGRSLRVTEQDVVNEEMYEEEDDDLPQQYRRLTAHLQTGSADFNRRLAAYLTNHVAMRSALDQAITNSYAQQYPNAPQFAHNNQTIFSSPFMPHGMPPAMPSQMQQMPQPQRMPQPSSQPYRQSPYPLPGTPGYRPHAHKLSTSVSKTLDLPGYPQGSPVDSNSQSDNRRMSMPSSSMSPITPATPHTPLSLQHPQLTAAPKRSSYSSEPDGSTSHSMAPPSASSATQQPQQTRPSSQPIPQPAPHPMTQSMPTSMAQYNPPNYYPDSGPFSMSLPAESQMLLGNTLDPNDPLTSMFMAGSENFAQPFFTYNSFNSLGSSNMVLKDPNFHPSYDGMSATLAPSALDMSPLHRELNEPVSGTTESTNITSFNPNYDAVFGDYKGVGFVHPGSSAGSGTVTPGVDGSWDAFINDNSWSENAT